MVQIISVGWFSIRFRFENLFLRIEYIIYITIVVIEIKIIMVWSWKKISCSMIGLALFIEFNFIHEVISKEIFFYEWILNSWHFSATLRI